MHPSRSYKYYYVYQTTNTINGKIYVGVHATNNLQNGYLGSGVNLHKSIRKHGKENFTKVILKMCHSYDEALMEERRIVTPEFMNDRDIAKLFAMSLGWVRVQRHFRRHQKPHVFTVDPIYIGSSPRYRRKDIIALIDQLTAG